MTAEPTTPAPSKIAWGRSAELRFARAYLSIGTEAMAGHLLMSERSYKAMESGRNPIPNTLWRDIVTLHTAFDNAVDDLVEVIQNHLDSTSAPYTLEFAQSMSDWDRSVALNAAAVVGLVKVRVDCADDREARALWEEGELT